MATKYINKVKNKDKRENLEDAQKAFTRFTKKFNNIEIKNQIYISMNMKN